MGMFMQQHLNFFLRTLVLFIVFILFLNATPVANAQFTGTATSEETDAILSPPTDSAPAIPSAAAGTGGDPGTVGSTEESVSTRAAIEQAQPRLEVDETDSIIYNTSVRLGGWIAAAGGALFDGALDKVVLKMGCWFVETPAGDCSEIGLSQGAYGAVGAVVNELWSVVRDLFNILFIFALVWIGLRMILFADDSGTQRTLGMLIAAALLINFSLYFTKTIVDVANYTAVAIHAVAVSGLEGQFGFGVGELGTDGSFNDTGAAYTPASASLSSAYMQALKISSWFSGAPIQGGSVVVYSIMLLLFSIILGITLAFGGIMLITRFIALVILMIFSPAMFLGWVLPSFKKYSSDWWGKFLGYAFFAPAYVFMLYLGLYTLIQLGTMLGDDDTYANALSNEWSTGMFTIFLFYALGIGFLMAATKVGQQMSVAGSNVAMNTTQGTLRRLRNGSKWGAGRMYSSASGRMNQRTIDRLDARERETGKTTALSRTRRAWAEKAQSKQFGGASSYKQRKDDRKTGNKRAVAAQNTQQLQNDMNSSDRATVEKAFQKATPDQLVKIARTSEGRQLIMKNARLLSASKLDAITKSEDVGEKETAAIKTAYAKGTTGHVIGTATSPGKGIGKASNAELNAIGYNELLKEENVVNLTPEKIDKLDLIDTHKDSLKAERSRVLVDIVRNGLPRGKTSLTSLSNMSGSKIADLPDEAFFATNPTQAANVQKFIRGLSFDALTEVSRKKDTPVKQQIRSILNSMAQSGAADGSYEKELHEWLNTDRVGRKFGIR